MHQTGNRDPLHGQTLEAILKQLVDTYGWEELGRRIRIKCFTSDPSISSSLKFLRKTPWARQKVEALFIRSLDRKSNTPPRT
ncbi:MAG: VF530 family DNA-binding protein [Spongiibacter sp.]